MRSSDLKKYAKLIVRIGANVQENQDVVVFANVNDEYFVKYVVEEAYKAKARKVSVEWSSDEVTKIVYDKTGVEALKELPDWVIKRWEYRKDTLPAMIYIDSSDPDTLAGIDQNKMMEVRKFQGPIIRPIRKEMENKYQWTIAAIPGASWAQKVFPVFSKNEAVKRLWEAILVCARAQGDPVLNWNKHNEYLLNKCNILNNLNIKKLYYKNSLGTDFNVSLIKDVIFMGGGANTIQGVYYNPNMPTEECFTTPNKYSANGVVYATKPLSVQGRVIKDFGFRFQDGKVVECLAKDDDTKTLLEQLTSLDEGASRLGEVALVPWSSPVNQTNLLFYNTLFDENACCHLAIGMGFEDCIKDFEHKTKEEIEKYDLNDSIIHVDFMIGSRDLSIKAELEDGSLIDIFKDGTWAI